MYIQRAQTISQSGGRLEQSTVHTEGTDNQSDKGSLGHCLLYIKRALATSQTGGT